MGIIIFAILFEFLWKIVILYVYKIELFKFRFTE
jgi:hypothetical protein